MISCRPMSRMKLTISTIILQILYWTKPADGKFCLTETLQAILDNNAPLFCRIFCVRSHGHKMSRSCHKLHNKILPPPRRLRLSLPYLFVCQHDNPKRCGSKYIKYMEDCCPRLCKVFFIILLFIIIIIYYFYYYVIDFYNTFCILAYFISLTYDAL